MLWCLQRNRRTTTQHGCSPTVGSNNGNGNGNTRIVRRVCQLVHALTANLPNTVIDTVIDNDYDYDYDYDYDSVENETETDIESPPTAAFRKKLLVEAGCLEELQNLLAWIVSSPFGLHNTNGTDRGNGRGNDDEDDDGRSLCDELDSAIANLRS